MKVKRRLQETTLIGMALVVAIPLLVMGITSSALLEESLTDTIIEKNRAETDTLRRSANNYFGDALQRLQVLALMLDRIRPPVDAEQVYLDVSTAGGGPFTEIRSVDRVGDVINVSPHDERIVGTSMVHDPLFATAYNEQTPYWSLAFISPQTNKPASSLSVPFHRGVLTAQIDISSMQDILPIADEDTGIHFAIVDQSGTYVAHTDKMRVARREIDPNFMFLNGAIRNGDNYATIAYDGQKVMVTAGTVTSSGWMVIIYQPVSSILAPAHKLRVSFLTGAVICLLLAVGLAVRWARKLFSPLQKVVESSQEIAAGNYDVDLPETNYVETSSLTQSFNRMVESVSRREQKIHELNQELVRRLAEVQGIREYVQSIVDSMPSILASIDESGKVIQWNSKAEEIMGISRDDAEGVLLPLLFHQLPLDLERVRRVVSDGEVIDMVDVPMQTKGEDYYVDIMIFPLDDAMSRGAVVRIDDVTERHMFKKALISAKDKAEAANMAKSEFVANMSHELRTPLNGMFGMMQLVLGMDISSEQRELLETSLASGRSLLRIINDILDFSKLEAGGFSLESSDFSPVELMESVRENFAPTIMDRHISLTASWDESVTTMVNGDEARLRQILFNVVGNAVKFTEKGEVAMEASMVRKPKVPDEGWLFFSVRDTGIGIPDEQIDRIFDAFTQVDGSYTRRYQGTGLGLGIVRRLVHLMGGTLMIESVMGRGSTFTFCVSVRLSGTRITEDATGKSCDIIPASLNILLAEDDRVNQIMTQRLLEKAGHSVEIAKNGSEAIALLSKGKFDLILMDIQMPIMSGLDATRTIRAAKDGIPADIPIIALTAHAMPGDFEACMEAGMNGHIGKPVEIHELVETISRVWNDIHG